MWGALAAQFMGGGGKSSGGGGDSQTQLFQPESKSSAVSDAVLDSSNWTVATGGSKALGGTAAPAALWIVGGVAAAALVVTALVLRGR